MARQARQTFLQRFDQLERHVRTQRIRRKGHTESKTFLRGVGIDETTLVPPAFIGIDHDGETPEWKRLTGFAGVLETGSATIDWHLNGVAVATGMALSTTPATLDLDTPIDLAHGDTLRPVITAASGATYLSAAAFIVTAAR